MTNIFATIGHFFKHLAVVVDAGFEKFFGSEAAHTFAVGAVALLKTELGKIASVAVKEAALVAQGIEAHGIAFAKIGVAAAAIGLEAKGSIVNMLIELAVQELKGAFGPAVQP